MDRKALIAIVLSTVLIVAYQIAFLKPPPPETAVVEGGADTSAPALAPGEAPGESAVPAIREAPVLPEPAEEEEEARLVRVVSPLYEVDIDTRGAMIRAIRLPRFEGHGGGPVVLVGPEGPPALGLLLATKDEELDLRGAVFRADREEVRVGEGGAGEALTLEKTFANGLSVRRVFRFRAESYRIDIEQTIARAEGAPETFAYRLLWEPGIAFTEGGQAEEKNEMAAVTALGDKVVRDPATKVKEKAPVERTGGVRFAALKSKYFALAIVPENESGADVWIRRIPGEERVYLDIKMPLRDPARNTTTFGLYAGPLDIDVLKKEGAGLEAMIDLGWTWIRPISRLTLVSMNFMYRYVPNYGVVILLVSLITKLLFYRLTGKSLKSMKDMQRIQGQVGVLREKFKGDAARLNKEMMALYKREGVNPLSGCLPMVLQMPVFIALYQVLQRTIALRMAPFCLWIDDLSRPDVLATFPTALPFLGSHLSLLPLLMGGTMFVQQKMTTVDPRQKAMIYMMPVLFTVLFYRLPSGLVLYWLINNVLSIGQQYLMNRGEANGAGGAGASPKADEGNSNTRSNKKAKGRGRGEPSLTKETT